MVKRNPKQEGSNLWDCIPQIGPCPNNCNQCFYNRPGAFYVPTDKPLIPEPEEVGDGIVRVNCGHDSNIDRDRVIEVAKQYKHFFFNTSIPNFDFPGPVVLTANPNEELDYYAPSKFVGQTDNLMFIRLRVSPTNLNMVAEACQRWGACNIPVVLTFMAYYDQAPPGTIARDAQTYVLEEDSNFLKPAYTWQKRHINSYYCATEAFMQYVTREMKRIGGRLVTRCGTNNSRHCKDCNNCSNYYWLTMKHMNERSK